MKTRKHLSASGLFGIVRQRFSQIKDQRAANVVIDLKDALMSGFAMFSLKDACLLAFDQRRQVDNNLVRVYGIDEVPSDTQMRAILDEVEPDELRLGFKDIIQQLQRGKELEKMKYMGGYLVSLMGQGISLRKRCTVPIVWNGRTREQERSATYIRPWGQPSSTLNVERWSLYRRKRLSNKMGARKTIVNAMQPRESWPN